MNGHMYFVATILTQGIWAGANAWNIAVVFIVAAVGVLMFGCYQWHISSIPSSRLPAHV